MGKIKVVMNKPVYLSQTILDLSKTVVYEFDYNYMKQKYNSDRLQLCYIDTSLSLVCHIKTNDFYVDITDDVPKRFDTSGYCSNHPLPIGLNKNVIELMKDKLGGAIMSEFALLRAKLYSFRKIDGSEEKKYKGIKECVVKKTLSFDDYKNCLLASLRDIYRSQLMFRLTKHEVHAIEVNKIALNRDGDKQISKKDSISTSARGHKSLSWSPILGELSLR